MKRLAVLLTVLWPLPSFACELANATRQALDDELVVYYRTEPATPVLTQHFSMLFRICRGGEAASVDWFKIDARMPAHNHGMNYRPRVSETPEGLYRVSGMFFHMPGLWRIAVDFRHGERKQRLSIEYPMS